MFEENKILYYYLSVLNFCDKNSIQTLQEDNDIDLNIKHSYSFNTRKARNL